MKKILLYLTIGLSLGLLFSCAATSKATTEKDEAAKTFEAHDEKGVVYLYRTGRMVGAALTTEIKVNGQVAGASGPGTYFRWEMPEGTYSFSCLTRESSAVVELDVKPGEQYFLRQDERLGITRGGRVTLKKVDDKKGKQEIKSCKLLVSTYHP